MKKSRTGILMALLMAAGLMLTTACTETTTTDKEKEKVEEKTPEVKEVVDKTGKEYTSAYVCPMHCEGSGSSEAGKCPVCNMDYVANDKPAEPHDHDHGDHDHDGHDHDDHAGDDHG